MKIFTLALMTALSSLHASNLYDHKLKTIDGEETVSTAFISKSFWGVKSSVFMLICL